jgi:predicted alpha/beta-fold hydrolase
VLKLAGEWGRQAPPELRAVAAVSPSIDLAASAAALHLARNRIYERYFLWNLKRSVRRKARMFPGRYEIARLRRLRSLRDFDERITAFYCGFTDADDYYARASASQFIDRISVPALVIHAVDDPFIRITPASRARLLANPHIRYLETEHGGHCGFLGDAARGDDGRWAERTVIDFLRRS